MAKPKKETKESKGGRPRTYSLDLPVYDSMEQMANSCEIPLHVLKWAKRQGCRFVQHGRCHLGDFIKWWFARDSQNDEEANEDWTKREKRAAALLKEVKLDEERSRVIDFNLVSKFIRHLESDVFFGELERLANEFPASLKGLSEGEIKVECDAQIKRIKDNIASQVRTWAEKKIK